MRYEWDHLMGKLAQRDRARYEAWLAVDEPETHPLFHVVPGEVEAWEVGAQGSEPAI